MSLFYVEGNRLDGTFSLADATISKNAVSTDLENRKYRERLYLLIL